MIVILCNSFKEAQDGFARFMDFLETYEPYSVSKVYEYSYCVETDDNLRYIFVDYRFESLADTFDDSIDYVELEEFLEGTSEYYNENEGGYL